MLKSETKNHQTFGWTSQRGTRGNALLIWSYVSLFRCEPSVILQIYHDISGTCCQHDTYFGCEKRWKSNGCSAKWPYLWAILGIPAAAGSSTVFPGLKLLLGGPTCGDALKSFFLWILFGVWDGWYRCWYMLIYVEMAGHFWFFQVFTSVMRLSLHFVSSNDNNTLGACSQVYIDSRQHSSCAHCANRWLVSHLASIQFHQEKSPGNHIVT